MKTVSFSLALLLVLAPAAFAEEPAAEVKALADKIEEVRKAGDVSAMRAEVKKAAEMHNGLEDAAARGDLQDAIGKVLKDKKASDARLAAADALGTLNDHKGAWKQLKSAMPDVKAETAEPLDLAVLKAVGTVADEGAIDQLLELALKAKDRGIARDAAGALAGYTGASKAKKVKILEGLFEIGQRIKPSGGGGSGKAVSPEASARWQEVAPALGKSLNAITARNIGTWEEWEVLFKDNKKTLAKLLPEE
jgi:hypothetical protein